ncbi:MAG TPA: wax ester/triacylglycerol synthase family O-acyltransferase [Nevskiaceae bacterium]|nr:wax ester/triacylglycerol synthase family O-acyltransferase [Nevskiaceae bacterium]
MRQLSSFDAMMLYSDNAHTPMHVAPFFIYDQSTAPGGVVRFKDILRLIEQRLHLAPIMRQKPLRVPLDLDSPYWVDDPDFDLESHVRHVALPKPGDRRQLSILLSRIHTYPMDLDRAPWDAYVIEGLDNVSGIPKGSFGLLLRIHHAAIDGASGHAILRVLHDLEPKPVGGQAGNAWNARRLPTRSQLLRRAAQSVVTKPRKIVKLAVRVNPILRAVRDVKKRFPGEQRRVPDTRFSGKISPHRVVVLCSLDLHAIRAAKKAIPEATVNDAIVSIVAGAMRRYLLAKGELPGESLSTVMPINIRNEAEKKTAEGNVVSITTLNMHSDMEDPIERMLAIHRSAEYAKAYHNAIGARIMSDVAEAIPAGLASAGIRAAASAGFAKIPANTIVTNVPGAQVPLYLAGAKVVEFHALGILLDGLGLFHAVNSYCGQIAITVLADRKMMPDPDFYEACLRASFDDFCAAAARAAAKPGCPAVSGTPAETRPTTA